MTDADRDQIREQQSHVLQSIKNWIIGLFFTGFFAFGGSAGAAVFYFGQLDNEVGRQGQDISTIQGDIAALRAADSVSMADRQVSASERRAMAREMARLTHVVDALVEKVARFSSDPG